MGFTKLIKRLFEEDNIDDKDVNIDELEHDYELEDAYFILKIEGVFALKEQGCVVAGKVLMGSVKAGEELIYMDESGHELFRCCIEAIEQNHSQIHEAAASGNHGGHYDFLILDHNKEVFKVGDFLGKNKLNA